MNNTQKDRERLIAECHQIEHDYFLIDKPDEDYMDVIVAKVQEHDQKRIIDELKIIEQAIGEISHAQQSGANWYTRGSDGLLAQVSLLVLLKVDEAIKKVFSDRD